MRATYPACSIATYNRQHAACGQHAARNLTTEIGTPSSAGMQKPSARQRVRACTQFRPHSQSDARAVGKREQLLVWGASACILCWVEGAAGGAWDGASRRPVPVQMWAGRARSRCRCGSGEPSPGADVAAASLVPGQMWANRRARIRRDTSPGLPLHKSCDMRSRRTPPAAPAPPRCASAECDACAAQPIPAARRSKQKARLTTGRRTSRRCGPPDRRLSAPLAARRTRSAMLGTKASSSRMAVMT